MMRPKYDDQKRMKSKADVLKQVEKQANEADMRQIEQVDETTISPRLQKQINDQLEENDSISSAVFENMMRNPSLRTNILRELAIAANIGKNGEETDINDDVLGTQYSG